MDSTITKPLGDDVRFIPINESDPSADQLQQSLQHLHAELARTPRVDEKARELLRDVLTDIERLLNERTSSVKAGASQSRLEALAVGFESEHPSIAASLREFVDLLGRAGL